MAVDNRIKEWELVTNTTKNLFMQDQSMTMFDHESDGNFGRVIGTPGVDPGGVANGWATTYSIAEALGTLDSRPAGTNPVFQLRAISGTWTASAGSATLSGTGGAASTELFAGRNIIINGKVNKVYGTTGANTITLYKQVDFSGAYTVYEVITVAERLNGVQNVNDPDLSYTGASLSYAGITSVRNLPTSITAGSLTVTGAAGWRYIVCTTAGVISVETIPVAEITADTQQYTPEPVFNSTYQGYYSTVNTTKRIIGILYFDSTNIVELITYGNKRDKNDDWYFTDQAGINVVSANDRFQFTGTWNYTRGTNLTVTDNGAGVTDASGFRITCNRDGWLYIDAGVVYGTDVGVGNTAFTILCNKNAGAFTTVLISTDNSTGAQILETKQFSLRVKAAKNDYFTFYTNAAGIGGSLYGINIGFEGV